MAETTLKMILLGEDRSASKALKGLGDEADKVSKKASGASSIMKGVIGANVIQGAASAVVDFANASVDAASRNEQALGGSAAVFGKHAGSMQKAAKGAAESLGLSETSYLDLANTLGAGLKNKGVDDFAGKSKDLITIGADLSAQFGGSTKDAVDALASAMRGESDPIEKYGVSLSESAIKAELAKTGADKLTGAALEQAKTQARLKIITDQTSDSQGAFSRESETLAGKQERLKAKFENTQAQLGDKLLPVMVKLADIAAKTVDWVSKNADVLGPLAVGIGVATGAVILLNAAMALNPIGIVTIAIAALVTGLVIAYKESETFRKVVDTAFKAIGAAGKWLWNEALQPALKWIVNGFAWVTDGLADMLGALGKVPGFGWAKDAADDLHGVAQKARDAAEGIKKIPDAKPEISARDKATAVVALIDKQIKALRGKVVEAKATGNDKGVRDLQAKIKALEGKKVNIIATLSASGSASWRISGGAGTGSLRAIAQANGGILRSYAGGGFEDHTAMIGNGVTRVWNEPETGGESYIPLAPAKRARSLGIWRETGRRLGVALADGGIAGGSAGAPAVTVMASVARGVDPLQFAREVEQELTKLARTRGGRLAFA